MAHDHHHKHAHSHVAELPLQNEEHHPRPHFQFCPKCGGSLNRQRLKVHEPERLVCSQCTFIFYDDPKVAACTIPVINDKIVLLRRGIEPSYGKWVFPGGYVDRGEEVKLAAIREAREEVGLDIRIDRLLNIYSYPGRAPVIVVYTAKVTGGCLACDDEGLEARFFDRPTIPWDELAFRSTREALREFLG